MRAKVSPVSFEWLNRFEIVTYPCARMLFSFIMRGNKFID